MCGSSGQSGVRQAQREEEARKAEIARATSAVDQAFGARQPQYDDFLQALQQHYTTDAQRQKEVADRQLRFSLARGGLTGGSAAVDSGRLLSDEFQRGLLEAERRAQSGVAGLRQQDEATRMNILSMIQGGMNTTTAAQQAARGMQANISGALAQGTADGLGNIFGGTADLYRQQQEAAARRRGFSEAEVYANPFSRRA